MAPKQDKSPKSEKMERFQEQSPSKSRVKVKPSRRKAFKRKKIESVEHEVEVNNESEWEDVLSKKDVNKMIESKVDNIVEEILDKVSQKLYAKLTQYESTLESVVDNILENKMKTLKVKLDKNESIIASSTSKLNNIKVLNDNNVKEIAASKSNIKTMKKK